MANKKDDAWTEAKRLCRLSADLGDGLLHALHRGLGLPSERVPAEARLEQPRVGVGLR
jgi:hypothetical protein